MLYVSTIRLARLVTVTSIDFSASSAVAAGES